MTSATHNTHFPVSATGTNTPYPYLYHNNVCTSKYSLENEYEYVFIRKMCIIFFPSIAKCPEFRAPNRRQFQLALKAVFLDPKHLNHFLVP